MRTPRAVCEVIHNQECEIRAKEMAEHFGSGLANILFVLDKCLQSELIVAQPWTSVPGPFWDLTDAGRRMIGK